jgi:heat shock protein HslJ
MMACDRGLEAQDQWLMELLESEPRLSLDGETLVIGTDANGMTMDES